MDEQPPTEVKEEPPTPELPTPELPTPELPTPQPPVVEPLPIPAPPAPPPIPEPPAADPAVTAPPVRIQILRFVIGSTAFIRNGDAAESEVAPFIDASYNRTMVPLRIIAEALGAEVRFNSTTRVVYITQNYNEISLGIDVPLPDDMGVAVIIDGHTFVPARYVSEVLGAAVRWDREHQAVYVYK